ncbi:MarR family transcriptional regulator [Dactylosporangium sp. CS-033363]|uniref:MarR family transcriptional regulator n=1 Tax=Dactylosporangium sp. CS-033363 TaxID=3239935 RepID=UPI003D8F755A
MDGQDGLTATEARVAAALCRLRPGEQATVGAIAARCGVAAARVRQILTVWEGAGLVDVEALQERTDKPVVRHYTPNDRGRAQLAGTAGGVARAA